MGRSQGQHMLAVLEVKRGQTEGLWTCPKLICCSIDTEDGSTG